LRTVLDLNTQESERVINRNTVELGLTAPTWISEGIDVERLQAKLKDDVGSYGSMPTPKQSMDIYNRRLALTSRISTHRQNAALFLDITITDDDSIGPLSEETEGQPENAALHLPSQLGSQVAKTERSLRVQELEIVLRRSECFETLRRVRTACMQKSQLITGKKKHARGEVANTRAQTMINRLTARVKGAINDYNRSYEALKRLVPLEKLSPFRQLLNSHLHGLDSILRPERTGQRPGRDNGEGRRSLPWFWTVRDNDNRSAQQAEEDEFNEGLQSPSIDNPDSPVDIGVLSHVAIRVEWFRGRERYRRWEEEVLWLRQEISSVLFSYHSYSKEWLVRSESSYADLLDGYKAYCLRQRDLYLGLMITGYKQAEAALKASPSMPICDRAIAELSVYVNRN
ncbi:hypothetical protein FRC11_012588, partial [Ceratobasidium sp. 423]